MESRLTPYHASPLIECRAALVFAPHPDDETLGCGGLTLALTRQGIAVEAVLLTSGDFGEHGKAGAAVREAETLAAAKVLGLSQVHFWREPDRGVVCDERTLAAATQAILAAGAGIAYMYGSQFVQALTRPEIDTGGLLLGSLTALCVPIAGAINWTVVQRSQTHGEKIDLVPSVLLGAVISSLLTLPFALPFAATANDVAWLAMLGLVQLAIPCALSVVCARVLKAPEVSLLALLEVIFGILLAWIWANEVPGDEVLRGGSLVIGALVINELLGWRSRAGTPRIQTVDQ